MWNLKKLLIFTDDRQEVTEIESITVKWFSYKKDFSSYGKAVFNAKVFTNDKDAEEFIKQLKEATKFINSEIHIEKEKN